MARMLVFALVVLLGSIAFAQTAEEYCASARTQGIDCYMSCCQSLGYSWAGDGCTVPEAERSSVASSCGYCTDAYVRCVDTYSGPGSSGSGSTGDNSGFSTSSSSSGCCAGFALLAAAAGLFSLRK